MPVPTGGTNEVELNDISAGFGSGQISPARTSAAPSGTSGSGHGSSDEPTVVLDGIPITRNMTPEQILQVMNHVLKKTGRLGHKLKMSADGWFDEKTWKWKAAVIFLALWGVIVPTSLTYHFNAPANAMSKQSLLATEWANYYTWLWTVCPAEQARNISTPECDKAQNQTTPPFRQPKPYSKRSIKLLLARNLWPNVNATSSLEADFDSTNEFCLVPDTSNPEILLEMYPECSALRPAYRSDPKSLEKRSDEARRLVVPVPPKLKTDSETFYSSPVGMFWMVFISYTYLWIFLSHIDWLGIAKASGGRLIHACSWDYRPFLNYHIGWQLVWVCQILPWALFNAWATYYSLKDSALWLAKDDIFTTCLSSQTSLARKSCSLFSELLTDASQTEATTIVSLWRAYVDISIELRSGGYWFFLQCIITVWFWMLVFSRLWDCFSPSICRALRGTRGHKDGRRTGNSADAKLTHLDTTHEARKPEEEENLISYD